MSTPVLDKREARIQKMFAGIAPWYDTLNHVLSLNIDKSWRRKTVKLVPSQSGGPILDLCTGTGDLAIEYHRATGGGVEVVGADFCHEMLVRAAKKSSATPIAYYAADAQQLPFADDHFEIVTVAFGLRNVTDPVRGLSEMVRVARPGGRVAVLEFSRPTHWFFGRVYRFYFRNVLPLVGQLLSRNKDSAYRYLPESVMQFPDGEQMAQMMRDQGLQAVVYHPWTLGIATLYIGTKPS